MPNNVLPILGEWLKKARKDRGLTQEQLAERRRARAAMRKENGKAQRLRAELNRKRALRKVRESGYLRECEVDNRIQDQLQASRTELRLQMQQLTAAVAPQSPEMAAKPAAPTASMAMPMGIRIKMRKISTAMPI